MFKWWKKWIIYRDWNNQDAYVYYYLYIYIMLWVLPPSDSSGRKHLARVGLVTLTKNNWRVILIGTRKISNKSSLIKNSGYILLLVPAYLSLQLYVSKSELKCSIDCLLMHWQRSKRENNNQREKLIMIWRISKN